MSRFGGHHQIEPKMVFGVFRIATWQRLLKHYLTQEGSTPEMVMWQKRVCQSDRRKSKVLFWK